MKSILIIIDYFGAWPEWFPIFLASCATNPTVDWLFHTDCPIPAKHPENVFFVDMSFGEYCRMVSDKLGISFHPKNAYKICDVRPAYGVLYADEIKGYDYYGYGDIDVIYGNIRKFYTDEVLTHDVVSASDRFVSGHLALFKNEPWIREAFRAYPGWKKIMGDNEHHGFLDERSLTAIFKKPEVVPQWLVSLWPASAAYGRKLFEFFHPHRALCWQNGYFVEQYSSPFCDMKWIDGATRHPGVWYWHDGRLTNEYDGDREFLYFHFMNYRSPRYMAKAFGQRAFWDGLTRLVDFEPRNIDAGIIRIDKTGFHHEPR